MATESGTEQISPGTSWTSGSLPEGVVIAAQCLCPARDQQRQRVGSHRIAHRPRPNATPQIEGTSVQLIVVGSNAQYEPAIKADVGDTLS